MWRRICPRGNGSAHERRRRRDVALAAIASLVLALAIGLSSTPGSARIGATCSPATDTCGADEFCEVSDGACAKSGSQGHCVAVSQVCAMLYQPVCGCNGQTFSNDCERRRAKVSKRKDGGC
jgi:hypothetical protein